MLCKGRKASFVFFIPMRTIECMKTYKFPFIIEKDEGGFFAECPALQGCSTQGDTREEAVANIKEAIECYLEDMRESNEEIPEPETLGLPTVEITI